MAAIAQVPAQSLGVEGISNISAETLAALEAGKERKSDEIATSFGESWEQAFRLGAHAPTGTRRPPTDMSSQVKWKNTTARSLAQVTDALTKWVTSLGVNEKIARQWIPGWTDQLEAENERLGPSAAAAADPLAAFMANIDRQSGGTVPTAETTRRSRWLRRRDVSRCRSATRRSRTSRDCGGCSTSTGSTRRGRPWLRP
jgi:hypothetical protein